MITTIIFDFGDVFINLEKEKTKIAFEKLGVFDYEKLIKTSNPLFEIGKISDDLFLESFGENNKIIDKDAIKDAWNTIIGDFPEYRLLFLKNLKKNFRLLLLSNTDAIHIEHFEKKVGSKFAKEFYDCFEKIYFSFEIGMRKPHTETYQYVLDNQKLLPDEVIFVDDKLENITAAATLGVKTWHLKVGSEDVIDFYNKNNAYLE